MNAQKSIAHAETVQHFAIGMLYLSDLNPRQDADEAGIADLADSIRACGLIQSLAGLADASGRVGIVAGGRRLRALQAIAGAGETVADVPVRLAPDEATAIAWAKTENIARDPLHPADEIAAYRDMSAAGSAPEAIAKAFAVTVRHVKGRLRLANLAPDILAALKAGAVTLDSAAAYTVTDDHDRQLEVFRQINGAWCDRPQEIRGRLTADAADADSRIASYVGRAAYEAAGGDVREDLFGDDVFFTDAALLQRLALEKLETDAALIEAAGWKWVEFAIDRPEWSVTEKMGRAYPVQIEASDEDVARYDELAALIEAEDATEDEEAEFEALSARLDETTYTDAQKAHSGAFVWIGYNGDVQSQAGMVRAEDRKEAEAAGACDPDRHAPAASPKEKPPYPAALMEDMARIRTGAVQAALLETPELTLDLLTFAMTTSVYSGASPLGLSTTAPRNGPEGGEGMDLPKPLRDDAYAAPLDGKGAAKAFAAFRRKKPETRARLLTEAVARIVSVGLAGERANPFAEMIAEIAGADARRVWTPTEAFLKRLTAPKLVEIHDAIMGAPSDAFAAKKKGDKAKWLSRAFAGGKDAPPMDDAQTARAAAWRLDVMGDARQSGA